MSASRPPPTSSVMAAEAPSDIGWQALGPAIGCTMLAIVVVILRWYTRIVLIRRVGLEDYFITVALTLAIAMTAVIGVEVSLGIGRHHHWKKESSILPTITILVLTSNVIYHILINITKASIIIQYLRIFSGKLIRRSCQIILFMLFGAACWGVLGAIFLCQPVEKFWHPKIPGKCMNARAYWLSAACINIGMDFIVWLLPMPVIGQLRLPPRQKLGLIAVFTVGGFVCVVSVLRLLLVHVAAVKHNFTKSGIAAITWSVVEANVGITCASMMAMKPLLLHFCPSLIVAKKPRRYNMRLPTVEDDFWQTTTSTTICRASRDCSAEYNQNTPGIKVTTETVQEESKINLPGLFPYALPLGVQAKSFESL
ncbi:hypothetical protein K432DRAFT_296485 [Lepidopterella palustris CBS 459.81]|uniref:Rhodopsin domain-containing protein n=1 Tax=Lepidopterella palustris CBS 459.81 TaxID=1314670 RepID=A0A8E2JGE3_9PEZI|nr:hypothetical protein K432DRAFT_296485 [Lepidopterella palustris CBS 459.81]